MDNLKSATKLIFRKYQKRYYEHYESYKKAAEEFGANSSQACYLRGHLNEAFYVLTAVYGLTLKEMREIVINGGSTNADLKE